MNSRSSCGYSAIDHEGTPSEVPEMNLVNLDHLPLDKAIPSSPSDSGKIHHARRSHNARTWYRRNEKVSLVDSHSSA